MTDQIKCHKDHIPSIKLIHRGNSLLSDLEILVCDKCINEKPFSDQRLEKELIQ